MLIGANQFWLFLKGIKKKVIYVKWVILNLLIYGHKGLKFSLDFISFHFIIRVIHLAYELHLVSFFFNLMFTLSFCSNYKRGHICAKECYGIVGRLCGRYMVILDLLEEEVWITFGLREGNVLVK